MNLADFKTVVDLLALPALLALSVYHLMIYWGRKKHAVERYNLYFSLFVLFVGMYLAMGSPAFPLGRRIFERHGDWIPPAEGLTVLGIFFGFTKFCSMLLDLPGSQQRLLRWGYGYLSICLSFPFLSPLKGSFWYLQKLFLPVVVLVGLYLVYITYIYGRWILRNKLYKEKIIKIMLAGTFLLVFYLLAAKLMLTFDSPAILQGNNLAVIVVVYTFAYALAAKFNHEYEELIALKENLELKIAERTAELTKAKEQIETASREKSDFFINLAHETKTPLTIISNYLERYVSKHGLSEEIGIIKRNLDKLCRDMVDFLDVEKLRKGHISHDNNQSTDFSKLLNEKIDLFREYAQGRNVRFCAEIESPLVTRADPYLLDRIIFNLIDNALKYTPPHGEIAVILNTSCNEIVFTVRDSGIGIPETKLAHVFEPYYQISHKKLNVQGMGMGLYIVKRSAELLGGSVQVQSVENKGSVFTVRLPWRLPVGNGKEAPCFPTTPVHHDQRVIERDLEAQKKTLLLVEDNPDMVDYLAEELYSDYNVFSAKNGVEALKRLDNIPVPDLIISDIMMDQMDGEEFYRRISMRQRYNNIPFIFLTAKTQQDEKIKMLQAGVVDYICKPFLIAELKARVKTVIENAEKQKREGLRQAIEVITNRLDHPEGEPRKTWLIPEDKCRQYRLTERQQEIVGLVAEGLEYKEIAGRLNISFKTVSRHIENLFDKLGVHNKVDLINLLFR